MCSTSVFSDSEIAAAELRVTVELIGCNYAYDAIRCDLRVFMCTRHLEATRERVFDATLKYNVQHITCADSVITLMLHTPSVWHAKVIAERFSRISFGYSCEPQKPQHYCPND